MTVTNIYESFDNVFFNTRVQFYKRSEIDKYMSNDFENLSIVIMTMGEAIREIPETTIKHFWCDKFDADGACTLILMLLEGDTL